MIKRLLRDQDMTQRELARKTGLNRQTIFGILSGRDTTIDSLSRITTALGVDFSELFPPPAPTVDPETLKVKQAMQLMKLMDILKG